MYSSSSFEKIIIDIKQGKISVLQQQSARKEIINALNNQQIPSLKFFQLFWVLVTQQDQRIINFFCDSGILVKTLKKYSKQFLAEISYLNTNSSLQCNILLKCFAKLLQKGKSSSLELHANFLVRSIHQLLKLSLKMINELIKSFDLQKVHYFFNRYKKTAVQQSMSLQKAQALNKSLKRKQKRQQGKNQWGEQDQEQQDDEDQDQDSQQDQQDEADSNAQEEHNIQLHQKQLGIQWQQQFSQCQFETILIFNILLDLVKNSAKILNLFLGNAIFKQTLIIQKIPASLAQVLKKQTNLFTILQVLKLSISFLKNMDLQEQLMQQILVMPTLNMVFFKQLPQQNRIGSLLKNEVQRHQITQVILEAYIYLMVQKNYYVYFLKNLKLIVRFIFSMSQTNTLFFNGINFISNLLQKSSTKTDLLLLRQLFFFSLSKFSIQLSVLVSLAMKIQFSKAQKLKILQISCKRLQNFKKVQRLQPISHLIDQKQYFQSVWRQLQTKTLIKSKQSPVEPFENVMRVIKTNLNTYLYNYKMLKKNLIDSKYLQQLIEINYSNYYLRSEQGCFYCAQFHQHSKLKSPKKIIRNKAFASLISIILTILDGDQIQINMIIKPLIALFRSQNLQTDQFKFHMLLLLEIMVEEHKINQLLFKYNLIQFVSALFGKILAYYGLYPFVLCKSSLNELQHLKETKKFKTFQQFSRQKGYQITGFWDGHKIKIQVNETPIKKLLYGVDKLSKFKSKKNQNIFTIQLHNFYHSMAVIYKMTKQSKLIIESLKHDIMNIYILLRQLSFKYKLQNYFNNDESKTNEKFLIRNIIIICYKLIFLIIKFTQDEFGPFFKKFISTPMFNEFLGESLQIMSFCHSNQLKKTYISSIPIQSYKEDDILKIIILIQLVCQSLPPQDQLGITYNSRLIFVNLFLSSKFQSNYQRQELKVDQVYQAAESCLKTVMAEHILLAIQQNLFAQNKYMILFFRILELYSILNQDLTSHILKILQKSVQEMPMSDKEQGLLLHILICQITKPSSQNIEIAVQILLGIGKKGQGQKQIVKSIMAKYKSQLKNVKNVDSLLGKSL